MKKLLILLTIVISVPMSAQTLDVTEKARQHPIVMDKPAVDFFEGAVLGNGAMGVIVSTRPDAINFYFGHNNVWDIRMAEDHRDEIGTFDEVMKKAKALSPDLKNVRDDEWFSHYISMAVDNYDKSYPRPFPCGTVMLGFDRRQVELIGHAIDIADGLCRVHLLADGKKLTLEVFTDMTKDILWFRLVDAEGQPAPSCFNRFLVIPDSSAPQEFPPLTEYVDKSLLGFSQVLPTSPPTPPHKGGEPETNPHPKDKAFRLTAQINATLEDGVRYNTHGQAIPLNRLVRYIVPNNRPFIGNVSLAEGLASQLNRIYEDVKAPQPEETGFAASRRIAEAEWDTYWQKSGIAINDPFLEEIWYWNHYFFNCAVKAGATCPGLWGNWSRRKVGVEWHGDYHLNYNIQQPFWLPFSSNRLDKNLPYVDMIDHLLVISKQWAKEYYGMRGAFFPHSAYPLDMTLHPYPSPDWGWEVFETPWAVQGLWWHYTYSMDTDFLKNRAFTPIKEVTLFLVDYMKRPDAHGPQWKDDKYHIFPSVPPELYSLQPGFKFNYDTQADITLTKFIFKAFLEAVDVLKINKQEAALVKDVKEILSKMPEYSTTESQQYGKIYTSVPEENDKMVYNVPANLLHIFPGEEFGMDSPAETYQTLVNTFKAHQNEGGNEIVFQNLQAARLGILDIEKFKRQVHYAMLPNKTTSDFVLQSGGRYNDILDFKYMERMGIWVENFALPLVINECLMQSYNSIIHLFPNWDRQTDAEFSTLRAVGAFLVSCKLSGGDITSLQILSEKGSLCKLKNPWGNTSVQLVRNGKPAEKLSGESLTFKTSVSETIEVNLCKKV